MFLFDRPRPESAIRQDADKDLLTPRELEVLCLVAEGLANAEVARCLWISVPTVKYHLSSIYEKLGVANRTGAARWAQRHGVLATADVAVP